MFKHTLLFSIVIMCCLNAYEAQITNKQCAKDNEYCLTHLDCCSKSCLSFSYKCVPVPPSASQGTISVPVKPIDTENRFGGDDGGASLTQKTCALNGEYCLTHLDCCSKSCLSFSYKCVPVPPSASQGTIPVPVNPVPIETENRFGGNDGGASLTQKTCALQGEYCLTHVECCSGVCFPYKCLPSKPPGSTPPVSKDPASQKPAIDFTNRIGEEGSSNPAINPSSTPKSCAAVGEYCLTASECCSKSCLSFAYKCVNSYDLYAGPSSNPTTPVSTANRFGDSSVDTNTGTRKCTSNGLYCFHNKECCSGACYKSICSTEIRLGVPESELTRPSAVNGPYIPVNNLDDLISRFGGQISTTEQSVKRQERRCKIVGDICSRHEDCCSTNCHSYKRKCVN